MRTILIALLLCLVTLSYGQWNSQTSGVTTGFNDVHFEDANTGWVVGAGGIILKTINGGSSWSALTSGTANQINSVFFTSSTNGAVVGSGGLVSVTFDGGNTWFKQITGYTTDFRDIFYTDIMTAYIVGDAGKILKSTDGGLTWVSKPNGAAAADVFWSVWFTDSNTGWAIGGNLAASKSTILKTTDAGESWTSQTSPTSDWFYNISFGDGSNGWAAGPNGHIAKTTNGGANWTLQNSGTATEWLYAIYAVDSQLAFAGGGSGLILNTKDGGANWNVQPSGLPNAIRNFHFLNSSTGWAVGDGGTILKFSPASIQLNQPNGGENWKAGTSERITWTSNGIANVKIEYSTDNGANWNLVVGSTAASAGEYSWSVPNNPSTQTLVKISDAVNSSMYDQSNSVFTISTPSLILNSPNGGERWRVGTTQNITWISSDIANVKIEYSIDDRATWKTLIASTPAVSGSYPWLIPDEPTLQAVVKISDVVDNLIRDDSNAPFHIEKPTLHLTSPNGSENWKSGSIQNINWASTIIANVSLYYSIDNGTTWNGIANNITATPGNYNWTVPDIESNQVLVKVVDFEDDKLADQSDAVFSIFKPSITVTSPNGGEMWRGGSNQNITWTSNNVNDVKIEFSADNGLTWSEIIANTPAVAGSYNGTVPSINTNQGLVRISDVADNKIVDQSDATFSIFLPSITLNSPNGGESWKVGSSQNISWLSHDVTNVKLDYSIDNGINWVEIINSTPANLGSFSWVVPNSITSQALVKVTDASDNSINDQSDSVFRIFNKSISVLIPNGGENWKVGSNQSISWISPNVSNVKIEYTTNSGANWVLISANTSSNTNGTANYFAWTVPNTVSTNCKVRITEVGEPSLFDISNSQFTVCVPSLTLTHPNGGENWKAGSSQNITWLSENILNVKIEYSIDDGESWTIITSNTEASTGTFNWVVPDFRSSKVAIRVSDTEDDLVTDRSDAVFRILKPQINLLTPIGGENVRAISNYLIEWETTDVEKVEINFSSDGGATWTQLVSAIETPDDAKYNLNWGTPDLSSTACLIRVADLNDASNYSVSNASFALFQSSLQVLTPNGGEQIKVGSKYNITWTSTNVGKIDISYTTDGISAQTIASNIDASLGAYEWNVLNLSSTNCKIIIQDIDFPTLIDRSDSPFSIVIPSLTLISPNGGEKWKVGSSQNITWTSSNVASIKIEYSTNNGNSWNLIAENIPAASLNYVWVLPDAATSSALVRITDSEDANLNDRSNGVFNIQKSTITLLSPNGGENWKVGSTSNITWNSEEVTTVKLVYSIDNGNNWKLIANSILASQGTFSWTIPNENSNMTLVKIISENDSTVFDKSDSKFTIVRPSLTILSPTNLEYVRHNQTYSIKWNSSGIDRIKIEYCFNDLYWTTIANDIDPASGAYDFAFQKLYPISIFDEPFKTDIHKIKFTDLDNPQNVVLTHFHIKQIELINPIGGETVSGDQIIPIKWIVSEYFPNEAKPKLLQFSLDNGLNWQTFFTEQGYVKNYNESPVKESKVKPSDLGWPVYPNRELKIRFRIKDYESNLIHELGENVTAVWDQLVIVKSPTQDSVLFASQNVDVKFQLRTAPLKVNLYFSSDNGSSWNEIGRDMEPTPISWAYDYKVIWQVPNISSFNCLIKITDAANENIFGISKKFSVTNVIVANKVRINSTLTQNLLFIPESSVSKVITLKVTREFKHEGQKLIFIHPDKTDPNKSAIEELINFPNTSDTLGLSAEFTQAFHLKSSILKVKLLDKYNNVVSTDSIFIITKVAGKGIELFTPAKVIINPPHGRQNYDNIIAGQSYQVTWFVKDSDIKKFNIYIMSGQSVVLTLANNLDYKTPDGSNAQKLNIRIPENFAIGNYTLCIADADNPIYLSSAIFRLIKPSLKVLSPNGGEIFKGDIKWANIKISANCLDLFTVYLDQNGAQIRTLYWNGTTLPDSNQIISTTNLSGKNFKIRVGSRNLLSDSPCYHDSFYVDESDNYFSINPPEIQLTYPNGGEKLISKQSLNITWKSQNVDNVIINYSVDNGITWNRIAEVVASVGNYLWNIPNTNSNNCLIKLSVSEDLSTYTQSSSSFSIESKRTPLISSVLWNNSNFNFIEGESPKAIVSDLTITNQLSEIHSAVVKMVSSDVDSIRGRYWLDYTPVPKISSSFNVANQKLVLNGITTIEDYKTAIQSIKFSYTGDPHKLDGEVFNTLSLQIFDGQDSSNVITRPMIFTSVNSAPVIADNSGNLLTYTIGEPPLKFVPSLSINDDVNLRGKAILEVNVIENYIMGEDLIGSESSPLITASFLTESAEYKMTSISGAPQVINNKAKNGLYYLVENGTKSVGKTKKLEIQYFDDYQAASNKIIKNVTVKAPVTIAPSLKPPEEVKIAHIAGGNIRVSWKDSNGNVKGFIIYRTTNKVGKVSASYSLLDEEIIGIVTADQLAFVDKTTAEGFTYTYRIASYNETGLSDLSAQPPIVVNSVIKPPTNLAYKLIAYNTIQLSWEDNSEVEEGFVLEAKHDTSSTYKEVIKLNKNLTSFNVYNFIYNRNYSFRLKAFNSNTTSDESNILEIKLQPTDAEELGFLPTEFALYQNYPNPFNPSTTINYHLPTASQVSIKVYDMLGREVAVLVNDYQNPGLYSIEMNSKYYNLGSGMYFYRIRAGVFSETKKMILLK